MFADNATGFDDNARIEGRRCGHAGFVVILKAVDASVAVEVRCCSGGQE
ncbi:MAG: hypothetical protein ACJARS_004379 [bacterium]